MVVIGVNTTTFVRSGMNGVFSNHTSYLVVGMLIILCFFLDMCGFDDAAIW